MSVPETPTEPALPQHVELLVVGGGINGLAIARDAAVRGLGVALVERDDLGCETSSWSSRMIHGGLRYLEHLDFPLVHESLREREVLFRQAPHLVRPMDLLIPIFDDSTRGRFVIKAGMTLYDLLSPRKSVRRHSFLGRRATIERLPALRRDGLKGAASYVDGQVELSERLCVEIALDALRHGAQVLTKTEALRLVAHPAGDGVMVTARRGGGTHELSADYVVNAAGPWVDDLAHADGHRPLIGGTRGSHIALPRFPGAPSTTVHFETEQGKPLLVIPWRDVLLVGSTDVLDATDRRPGVSGEERDLLLRQVNRLFPDAGVGEADILFEYAGIRPLPHVEKTAATAITRRHHLHVHPEHRGRVLSVIGGKLTTHRHLAEEVVDAATAVLGRRVPCTTAALPLPGAQPDHARGPQIRRLIEAGIEPGTAAAVVARYGALTPAVAQLAEGDPALARTLPGGECVAAEVVHAVHHELARSVTDVVCRRLVIRFDRITPELVDGVTRVLTDHCGWSSEHIDADRQELAAFLRRLGVHLGQASPVPSAARAPRHPRTDR